MLAGALPVSELRGGVDEAVVLTPLVRPRLLLDAKDYEGGGGAERGYITCEREELGLWGAARLGRRALVPRAVAARSCAARRGRAFVRRSLLSII